MTGGVGTSASCRCGGGVRVTAGPAAGPAGPPSRSGGAGGGTRRWIVAAFLVVTGTSLTANAMVAVLVPWLVLTRTGSPAQAALVGAVALASAVPALLLGGPLIDRWGKRRVSVGADVLSACAVAALPLLDAVLGLSLLSILVLVAIGATFDGPGAAAREAARPEVATAAGHRLTSVNGRGEAVDGLAQIAGPATAGAALGLIGVMTSLWVAAALLVVAAAAGAVTMPRDIRREAPSQSYGRSALAGVRVVWQDRTLRSSALLGTLTMTMIAPFTVVLAAHLAPAGRGGLLGSVIGALGGGAVVGSLAYERLSASLRRQTILIAGLIAAATGFIAMGVVISFGIGAWVLMGAAAFTGVALGPLTPALSAVTQERADPAVLGRVVSTTWSLTLVAGPLALIVAGLLVEAAGPTITLATMGGGLLLAGLYAARTPGLHHLDPRP